MGAQEEAKSASKFHFSTATSMMMVGNVSLCSKAASSVATSGFPDHPPRIVHNTHSAGVQFMVKCVFLKRNIAYSTLTPRFPRTSRVCFAFKFGGNLSVRVPLLTLRIFTHGMKGQDLWRREFQFPYDVSGTIFMLIFLRHMKDNRCCRTSQVGSSVTDHYGKDIRWQKRWCGSMTQFENRKKYFLKQ